MGSIDELVLKGEGVDDKPSSTFRLPVAATRRRRVEKMPVPEKCKLNLRELDQAETTIKTQPNPAWRDAASQLERGAFYSTNFESEFMISPL